MLILVVLQAYVCNPRIEVLDNTERSIDSQVISDNSSAAVNRTED